MPRQILAGAAHLLDWDLVRFMEFTGTDLATTLPLATSNPAALLDFPPEEGELEVGAPADLMLFRYAEGDARLAIDRTLRGGVEVFSQA